MQVAEFEFQQIESKLARHTMGRDVEFRTGAARRAAGIIGKFHGAAASENTAEPVLRRPF